MAQAPPSPARGSQAHVAQPPPAVSGVKRFSSAFISANQRQMGFSYQSSSVLLSGKPAYPPPGRSPSQNLKGLTQNITRDIAGDRPVFLKPAKYHVFTHWLILLPALWAATPAQGDTTLFRWFSIDKFWQPLAIRIDLKVAVHCQRAVGSEKYQWLKKSAS